MTSRVEMFGSADEPMATRWNWLALMTGFFFSFRALSVLIASRVFLEDPHTGVIANGVIEGLLVGLAVFQAVGPEAADVQIPWRNGALRWALGYLAFSGMSLEWSGAVSMSSSALYWGFTASDVLLMLLMLRRGKAAEVAGSVMAGFVCSTMVLAVIAWCMPTQPDLRLGDKEYFNTNQLANLCAFGIFFGQYLSRRKMGQWMVPNVFLLVTLLRSLSKTTIAAFVVAEAVLLWRDRSLPRRIKLSIAALVVVLGVAFAGLFAAYFDVYSNTGNQAETLTGRIGIWAYATSEAIEKPWLGHGFDSMWKVFPPFGPDQFEPRHAENELLQQFFAYGLCGVIFLCAIYGGLFRLTNARAGGSEVLILRAMLIYAVVRGLAEAEPFDLLLPLWLIVLIIVAVKALATKPAWLSTTGPATAASFDPGRQLA